VQRHLQFAAIIPAVMRWGTVLSMFGSKWGLPSPKADAHRHRVENAAKIGLKQQKSAHKNRMRAHKTCQTRLRQRTFRSRSGMGLGSSGLGSKSATCS